MSSVVISGDTSGSITLSAPAVAGTNTITLPATTGTVVLTGTTPTLNGITFPATQVPSADANTLDDYEEGSWTPIDGSGAGLTISVTTASYIKIGKLVFVNTYLSYPATANATPAAIGGLPFTSASNSYSYTFGRNANGYTMVWQVQPNSTVMGANNIQNAVTPTNANLTGSYILVSGCYISAN